MTLHADINLKQKHLLEISNYHGSDARNKMNDFLNWIALCEREPFDWNLDGKKLRQWSRRKKDLKIEIKQGRHCRRFWTIIFCCRETTDFDLTDCFATNWRLWMENLSEKIKTVVMAIFENEEPRIIETKRNFFVLSIDLDFNARNNLEAFSTAYSWTGKTFWLTPRWKNIRPHAFRELWAATQLKFNFT